MSTTVAVVAMDIHKLFSKCVMLDDFSGDVTFPGTHDLFDRVTFPGTHDLFDRGLFRGRTTYLIADACERPLGVRTRDSFCR